MNEDSLSRTVRSMTEKEFMSLDDPHIIGNVPVSYTDEGLLIFHNGDDITEEENPEEFLLLIRCPICGAPTRLSKNNGHGWDGNYEEPTLTSSVDNSSRTDGCRGHYWVTVGQVKIVSSYCDSK